MLNLKDLSLKATFELFETLVLPVASYGSQVWLPHSAFFSALNRRDFSSSEFMNKSALNSTEMLHLRFLKRSLEVHKEYSNLAFYGDTGKSLLAVFMAKQTNKRPKSMEAVEITIAGHAFSKRRLSQLTWYQKINEVLLSAGIL